MPGDVERNPRIEVGAIHREMLALADPQRAVFVQRFFKTAPGEYGAGDRFLGLTVPQVRRVALKYQAIPLPVVRTLLKSPWHEERLPLVMDRIRNRLDDLSPRLGDAEWLDGDFSAGDLMMVEVLRRLRSSDVLAEITCRDDRLQAELMVPQRGLALLRTGQLVKLRYDAFPFQRFGVRHPDKFTDWGCKRGFGRAAAQLSRSATGAIHHPNVTRRKPTVVPEKCKPATV